MTDSKKMELDNILISVIMPTRNKRPALMRRALESIAAQTADNPFEVLIINDGGESLNVSTEYQDIQLKITAIHLPKQVGAAAARNAGIKKSTGALIAFLDDDDIWHSEKTAQQLAVFENDNECGLVYCRAFMFGEDGTVYDQSDYPLVRGKVFSQQLIHNYMPTSSVMVHRECFDMVGLFDEKLPSRQDHDMFLRIAREFSVDYVADHLTGCGVQDERISFDVQAKQQGWQEYISKWSSDPSVQSGELRMLRSAFYLDMGLLYRWNRKRAAGLAYAWKAICNTPLQLRGYLLMGALLLGIAPGKDRS